MREAKLPVTVKGLGTVSFRATEELESTGDAQLALNLIPAMRVGAELSVEQASPRLLASVPRIQDVFRCWDPTLEQVTVAATASASTDGAGDRVASFFSGGVDSFYTALTAATRSPI